MKRNNSKDKEVVPQSYRLIHSSNYKPGSQPQQALEYFPHPLSSSKASSQKSLSISSRSQNIHYENALRKENKELA